MKVIKRRGFITGVFVFLAIVTGVIGYKIGEKPKNDLLTLKTIVKTLEKQGITIIEDKSKAPNDYQLANVKPTIFSVNKGKGMLLVYTFKSIEERQKIVGSPNRDNQFSTLKIPFTSKNAYLVYIVSVQENPTDEEWKKVMEPMNLISDIVFKDLNDGKEIVFTGESTNWQGTYTLKYYEHSWHDETGVLKHERYSEEFPEIKYKKDDIEAVGSIEFEYKTNSGGGSLKGGELNKDGYLKGGSSGGNGSFPSFNEEIKFTVKWNGEEENIILKAK